MPAIRRPIIAWDCCWIVSLIVIVMFEPVVSFAQIGDSPTNDLMEEVDALNDPSYRARQLARWRLEQNPARTLRVIRDRIGDVDHNAGAQLVDLLTLFAMHKDVVISSQAMDLLRSTSRRMSSVGQLADNSLQAIADLQEEQAIEILVHHRARIGMRDFSLNGQIGQFNEMALHIDEDFTGDDEVIQWIRFLQTIETVYLEGPDIDTRHFKAISYIKDLRNIKLKHVTLTQSDLEYFRQFSNLHHLGINYAPVGDDFVDLLAELPVSESMRLFGTQVTRAGEAKLVEQLDGIEIYCGRGGFLGVSTSPISTRVGRVTDGSAAKKAGIQEQDVLTHINGKQINTFFDLRRELAEYVAGDELTIELERNGRMMTVDVVLSEDPTK